MTIHPNILQFRRLEIEARIEELIALLDLLDGDCDLEPYLAGTDPTTEDREEENEHGGDIQDEPHDAIDEGNDEPSLGWPEKDGQGRRIGIDCGPGDITYDPNDTDGIGVTGDRIGLAFDGDGYHLGRKLLREGVKDRHKLAKALDRTRVSPGYGKYV